MDSGLHPAAQRAEQHARDLVEVLDAAVQFGIDLEHDRGGLRSQESLRMLVSHLADSTSRWSQGSFAYAAFEAAYQRWKKFADERRVEVKKEDGGPETLQPVVEGSAPPPASEDRGK